MILKMVMITLLIIIAVNGVSGAAFSKVFVQGGSESFPFEYIQYGVPSVSLAGPQIGKISTGSVGQVVPVPSEPGLVAPCAMPCIYPGQVVSAVAPISPAAPNIVTYKSSGPVVMSNKEETPGYEYSYIVYDENTGDHKSQYELSDGSIVQGEYSLLQPDGYVREVTYVADDARGFNAIVKHFLPEKEQKKKESNEKTNLEQPCPEVKNDTTGISEGKEEKPSEDTNQKLSKLTLDDGKKVDTQKKDQKLSSAKKQTDTKTIGSKLKDEPVEQTSTNEINQKESGINKPKGLISEPLTEDIPKQKIEKTLLETQQYIKPAEVPKSEASPTEDKKDSTSEINKGKSKDNTELAVLKTKTAQQPGLEGTDILVPYNDIIKCVQAAVNGANKVTGVPKSESPLTYIVLNNPC